MVFRAPDTRAKNAKSTHRNDHYTRIILKLINIIRKHFLTRRRTIEINKVETEKKKQNKSSVKRIYICSRHCTPQISYVYVCDAVRIAHTFSCSHLKCVYAHQQQVQFVAQRTGRRQCCIRSLNAIRGVFDFSPTEKTATSEKKK